VAVEFIYEEHVYRIGKLNGIDQLKLMRKIAPLIVQLAPAFKDIDPKSIDEVANALVPMVDRISEMPDADIDYIRDMCYKVAQRRIGENKWAPMLVPLRRCSL
jgi:hypothetical protein